MVAAINLSLVAVWPSLTGTTPQPRMHREVPPWDPLQYIRNVDWSQFSNTGSSPIKRMVNFRTLRTLQQVIYNRAVSNE
jgi:hypothetical protein